MDQANTTQNWSRDKFFSLLKTFESTGINSVHLLNVYGHAPDFNLSDYHQYYDANLLDKIKKDYNANWLSLAESDLMQAFSLEELMAVWLNSPVIDEFDEKLITKALSFITNLEDFKLMFKVMFTQRLVFAKARKIALDHALQTLELL
jgi:hypothetical protein